MIGPCHENQGRVFLCPDGLRGIEEIAAYVNGRLKDFGNDDEEFWDEYTPSARDEVWLLDKIGMSPQQVRRCFSRPIIAET